MSLSIDSLNRFTGQKSSLPAERKVVGGFFVILTTRIYYISLSITPLRLTLFVQN
jgi:hypothetical protein